jgi:hypothetical protein
MPRSCVFTKKFPCLQEIPPSDLVDQGDEGEWDTVGEPARASRSPTPTVDELLAQLSRQPPVAEGSTHRPLLSLKRQRLLKRKRRRLLRLGWSTSPVSLVPQL